MLKGQAKTDYQREYMRNYMRLRRAVKTQPVKTPDVKTPVRPYGDAYYAALARQQAPK